VGNGQGPELSCRGWPPGSNKINCRRHAAPVSFLLAALHALDPGPLRGTLGPADWSGFLAGQRATAAERQRQVNLPDPWLSQIEAFLDSVPLTPEPERVLLHTELIREHLLVDPGTWTLNGLLDFETAMTGDRAYEFAPVGLFVSRGDPRELLAYTLLHRHSNWIPWPRPGSVPPRT
jgi:hygromycin-B 7''-O-kinase